jgi:hypothetical protein
LRNSRHKEKAKQLILITKRSCSMNQHTNQAKRGKVQRVLLALLLAGVLGVGSFYAPGMVETAYACQHAGGGGGC